MKLNHDCVRDLLFWFEDNLPLAGSYQLQHNEVRYTPEDISYTAQMLIDAGYLEGKAVQLKLQMPIVIIKKITWEGHKFLDNIRSDTAWSKSKDAAKKLGGASLSALSQIASQIVVEILKGHL